MELILKYPYFEKITQSFPLVFLFLSFLFSDISSFSPPLNLGYSVLFYWTVYRPDLIPLKGLFIIGLVIDGMMGRDLGVSFLQILFVFTLVLSQRFSLFQASFSVMWVGFMFFMAIFCTFLCGLQFMLEGKVAYETMFFSYVWVIASYPLLSLFLIKVHHFLR